MRHSSVLTLLAPVLIALPTTSCRVVGADPTVKPIIVTVDAGDFYFRMPDTLEAGMTTLRLVNAGPSLHHVSLFRLEGDHTMADLLAALGAGGPPPEWAGEVGGPNAAAPGDSAETTLELEPGRYAALCFIPTPDGVPHVMKGMSHAFTVLPASSRAAGAGGGSGEPAADVTLTLDNYSFTIEPELAAGPHMVRVVNRASQPHEVVFVRLEPGRTVADVAAWADRMEGPPPGRPIGGTTGFRPGLTNFVRLDLEPGEYGLLCFLPDAQDGRSHIEHGMTRQITVR
jgi:hypothetical protein